MQSFLELCKQRYSVRSFSPKALQQAELDYILEAAKVAPTARNNQPWRIYILQSEEALAKIAGVSDCIFGAPCVFLICCHEEEAWHSPVDEGYHAGEMDASIVCTHMMLAAWELGIGSCWVKRFSTELCRKTFNLEENIKPVCLLPAGYPSENAAPSPRHESFRPLADLVKYL